MLHQQQWIAGTQCLQRRMTDWKNFGPCLNIMNGIYDTLSMPLWPNANFELTRNQSDTTSLNRIINFAHFLPNSFQNMCASFICLTVCLHCSMQLSGIIRISMSSGFYGFHTIWLTASQCGICFFFCIFFVSALAWKTPTIEINEWLGFIDGCWIWIPHQITWKQTSRLHLPPTDPLLFTTKLIKLAGKLENSWAKFPFTEPNKVLAITIT